MVPNPLNLLLPPGATASLVGPVIDGLGEGGLDKVLVWALRPLWASAIDQLIDLGPHN